VGKRSAIFLVIILVSGLAILGYFLHQGRKSLFTDPYRAISPGACIIIETVDLQSFMNSITTEQGIFGEAGNIKELDSFNRKLKYLTDILNNVGIKKLFDDGTAIISFHPTNQGKLLPLLSLTVPGELRYRQIKDILRSSGINEMIEGDLNNYPVFKLPYMVNNKRDTVFISLFSGLMVCSSSKQLIEEAHVQIGGEDDIRNLPGFSRVLLASGKNEDKVFVVFSNLPKLIKSVLSKNSMGMADRIANLAGTAGGDIYINEDGVVFSGYTESIDSSEFLYKYKFSTPRTFQTYNIFPHQQFFLKLLFFLMKFLAISPTGLSLRK